MDYSGWVKKSANLHIQHGRHGLIGIFKINVNAFQSLIFFRPRDFFSEHPLMDYLVWVRKSANLHIKHGRHRLICISKIDVNTLQSPIFIRSSQFFFSTIDRLSWSSLKISWFAYSTWPPWANLYIQDRCKCSPVANVHQIFIKKILSTLWWISLVEFENQLICISKMVAMALMLYSPIVTALAINFYLWKVETFIFAMQI